MKYAVDRIINDIAILENIETNEMCEIDISTLPFSIYEGAVISLKNGIYYLEENVEARRRKMIEDRFKRIRDNS